MRLKADPRMPPEQKMIKNCEIKVIAFDLDGTLLRDDKTISERTAGVLSEAAASGLIPVPVTGRPLSGIPEAVISIPGLRYVITSNGSVTTDASTGRILRSSLIDPDESLGILDRILRRGLLYSVFAGGYGYTDHDTLRRIKEWYSSSPLSGYITKTRRETSDMETVLSRFGGAENIWIMAGDEKERDELDEELSGTMLRTVKTAPRDIEIGALGADKGIALRELCSSLGIDKKQILALGDSDNDRGLASESGTFAAVANASEDILRRASFVTASNNSDGPALVIESVLSDPEGYVGAGHLKKPLSELFI